MLPAAVAGVLPRRQAVARASVSALVASLPVLYVSLLRRPPAALAGDTAFWFLMSNCVIAAIVATSGDAGTLLFRSAADDDGPSDVVVGGLSCASAGQAPVPVPGVGSSDAAVPLAAAASSSQDELPAVDVDMNGGRVVHEEVASAVTSSYSVDQALPSLLEDEEEDQEVALEPSTVVKSNTVEVEGQGAEEDSEVIPLAIIEDDSELELEPGPWSRVVASTTSLPEEEAADGEWPIRTLYSSPPDQVVARDKGVAAAREGELRRSATVGSRPAADEESEYWKLSDEELNRRVEDFIARFNREMRLQIEQEAGA